MQPSGDLERECGPAADGGWRCAPYAACTHPGGCLLGDLADPEPAGGRGPVVPIAPDPARDARVDAYRDRERRRAARALDRYIEMVCPAETPDPAYKTAGERFVEQVGDYVVARLTGRWNDVADRMHDEAYGLHQKADYGVPAEHDIGPVGRPAAADHSTTQRDLASAVMPHPTCQDVSAFNEPLGTRWACTNACPR